MNANKKNIDTQKMMLNALIKALMNTADKYANITMAKMKKTSEEDLKKELKKMKIPFYETDINQINKKEIDENGEKYNPIVEFLNKNNTQKVFIIKINNILKKRDLEILANLKVFCEIDGEGILPNTLTILDLKIDDLLKESIDKMDKNHQIKYNFIFHDILFI